MAPSPAPWAVLGDVLWCLGLGCLLAGVRDAVRLALGEGALRCFFRDIAAFAAAAVLVCGFAAGASAGGLARWYMSAALLLGAVCWHWTVQPAVHRCAAAAALSVMAFKTGPTLASAMAAAILSLTLQQVSSSSPSNQLFTT